ncbi:MAG TPA: MSMEG_1061 family FMN-dependent PPOX-type flavoprotein [Usitatibacter sp.]|nr:MSMEG_1061 family FMN-dependent PPOX-type flavoprotein [Usitatibacter sp.]
MKRFGDVIDSLEALRAVIGPPVERSLRKEITRLDRHCRALIGASPFVLVGSADAKGRVDVSPKGDAPGFVRVLDDETLAIADRPGNRRADTFGNVLGNPRVGLLFVIPGKLETLRVNGRAIVVRDVAVREATAVAGKLPELVLIVTVEQAFIHCGKCMLRSKLWDHDAWRDTSFLPSQAECLVDHGRLDEPLVEIEAAVQLSRTTGLY